MEIYSNLQLYQTGRTLHRESAINLQSIFFDTGAQAAGLTAEYVESLRRIPAYSPTKEIVTLRRKRGELKDYPEVTLKELQRHKSGGDVW